MNKQTLPMQGRLPDFLRMQASRDSKPVRENLMSQAADALEAQEKRIAELEGALRSITGEAEGASNFLRNEFAGFVSIDTAQRLESCSRIARRVLGGGK